MTGMMTGLMERRADIPSGFAEPIFVTRPLLPDFDQVTEKLRAVWESQYLTNVGPQHKQLESALRTHLGVGGLSLFCNGTMALLMGMRVLGLTGEVITTPFTFPATVEALDWNGLTPVFCDVCEDTYVMDPERIEALITERTSAILAVHVFGNTCDVHRLQDVADRHHLRLIYDCAHAFGRRIDGKPVGCYGDMCMFSFHATKLFHTVEGGAIAYCGEEMGRTLELVRNFGISSPEEVLLSGLNGKMSEVHAAIGLEVLSAIPAERAARKRIMDVYMDRLQRLPGIRLITKDASEDASLQYFAIAVAEDRFGCSRDTLHEALKKYNIFTRKYFYPLCSDLPWYGQLESACAERLPVACRAAHEVLVLPFYGELGVDRADRICTLISCVGREFHEQPAAFALTS